MTIQLSQGMSVLFMGGDWNVCHTRVDWNCFTPHQWVLLVMLRVRGRVRVRVLCLLLTIKENEFVKTPFVC